MSDKHSAGKGARYRPVDQSKWDVNWEKAFSNKKRKVKNERSKNSKTNNRRRGSM